MIDHFIISGEGKVGGHVTVNAEAMGLNHIATTHRLTGYRTGTFHLDLLDPFSHGETGPRPLPDARIVYLIAGIAKFRGCEMDPNAWRVNVDAPIAIARYYSKRGAFIVYVSSDAVEWCGTTELGRQKAHVECYMNTIDSAIIRPSAIDPKKDLDVFAKEVLSIGASRKIGVHRWRP